LVAVFNEDEEKYHVYLTNFAKDVLEAEDVAKLYGARWDIELIFKELKSRYALDVVNTKNTQIIRSLYLDIDSYAFSKQENIFVSSEV